MSKNKKTIIFLTKLCALVLLIVSFSSCAILAITAESFRKAGLTTESRKELLPSFVVRFSDAMSLFDATRALAFSTEEYKPELRARLLKEREKVKVIGNEVILTEYNDDATRAEVSVKSKFYRIPVYVAEEKMEKQIWIYDGGGVWKLDDIEALNVS